MFEIIKSMVTGVVAVAIGLTIISDHHLSPVQTLIMYSELNTPNAICEKIHTFKYERDKDDEPSVKPTFMFLKEKKGDCKDFANFAHECGKYNNINCKYYLMFNGKGEGHASSIWKINGKYYPICNVTCIGKNKIKAYSHIEDINKMYIKAFEWKEIAYSYYATPYPFFWKPETTPGPIRSIVEDF